MFKKALVIFLTVGLTLFLSSGNAWAGLCDPCDVADHQQGPCGSGYECIGDPTPGDGKTEGRCYVSCGGRICIQNPLSACSFQDLVDNIIDFVFYIALGLVPLMVLIGAFFLMTAGGDPKRIETGRKTILYTVVGLAIILFAKGFIAILSHIFGAD